MTIQAWQLLVALVWAIWLCTFLRFVMFRRDNREYLDHPMAPPVAKRHARAGWLCALLWVLAVVLSVYVLHLS